MLPLEASSVPDVADRWPAAKLARRLHLGHRVSPQNIEGDSMNLNPAFASFTKARRGLLAAGLAALFTSGLALGQAFAGKRSD
jgi:hypothetical protein